MGEHKKTTKKFAVGEIAPSPSTSTGKKSNTNTSRHHVKRRSNSRAHVSKLAPTGKAEEKPMKRSHSNKSLTRLTITAREEEERVVEEEEEEEEEKSPLRSQFVESGKLRTQQKLLLQREQSSIQDENSPSHPKNMIRLTREIEKMGKEYRCVRKYQDPMMDSLMRCQQLSQPSTQSFMVEQRKQAVFRNIIEATATTSTDNRWSTFLERLVYGPT
ncbi:hypothetical protein CU098_011439 [Rhizopus stolonifer]|uniref:Uncharacterized protein n=1 Tax=Rhizopus stolonifer TaxID=4846 RepID=A0A367KMT6_RHIST|nr:hypothetical protein CU098_011439 [Rhizopus stolonifer]